MIWETMCRTIDNGLNNDGVLPGGLKVARKACTYWVKSKEYGPSISNRSRLYAYALATAYSCFDVGNMYFCNTPHKLFNNLSESNVSEIKIGENAKINMKNHKDYIEISCENKKMIFFDSEKEENLFEKAKEYDIIIVYGKNATEIKEKILKENSKICVYVAENSNKIAVNFNVRK